MTQTLTDVTAQSARDDERQQILAALSRFAEQRPGIEPMNYGGGVDGWRAYRSESRSVTRDLHQARQLLKEVTWRSSIDAEALKAALRGAYSGRLTWVPAGAVHENSPAHASTAPHGRLEYCTGQYFPTEFRRAVCAVCASALWNYARENGEGERGKGSPGDNLRAWARREFGRTIAARWFN